MGNCDDRPLAPATLDTALAYRPAAVMLSFADPSPFAEDVRRSNARLIVQVTDLDEARRALDVGADVIVAQGGEAGGHGGRRGTLPFVPAVVDLAGTEPGARHRQRRTVAAPSTRHGPCATHSWSAGAAARKNSPTTKPSTCWAAPTVT
jgi:hypothetical protein